MDKGLTLQPTYDLTLNCYPDADFGTHTAYAVEQDI